MDPAVQALLDKQQITEVLMLYSRGIDRRDEAALRRVYWDEAVDDHGQYCGPAPTFIAKVLPMIATMKTSHMLGNVLIELRSDSQATSETYFLATHVLGEGDDAPQWILGGRYLDRFEKRGAEWRILERTVAVDYQRLQSATQSWSGWQPRPQIQGAAKPDDPLYRVFEPGGFPIPGGAPYPD